MGILLYNPDDGTLSCHNSFRVGDSTKTSAGTAFSAEKAYRPDDLLENPPLPAEMKREQKKEVTEMVSSITAAAVVQPVAPATPAASDNKKATAPKQQSSGGADTDTIHLSSTAQAQLSAIQAALQEATETPAQKANEALGGDHQAKRLLAHEAQAGEAVKLGQYGPGAAQGR